MKIMSIGLSALIIAILLPQSLFAGPIAPYIWSDSKGFLIADTSCQTKQIDQVPFFVSQKPNSQLNASSKLSRLNFLSAILPTNLVDRSLITATNAPNPADGSLVRVISVPKNANYLNSMNISKAGDTGYLAKESLQEIDNFIIEVIDLTPSTSQFKAPFHVQKSFWQASVNNEKFVTLVCGNITKPVSYVLFDIYDSTSTDPIAQVGLNPYETKILSSIYVYTSDEANQVISTEVPAEEPTQKPLPSSGTGKNVRLAPLKPTPPPPNSPSKNPKDTIDVPISEGDLEYVICSEEKTSMVFGKDLKTPIFTAKQFESIIPSQSWDEKQKTTHLNVQFPNRKITPNTGWVPRSLVQLRSECAPLKKDSSSDENAIVNDSLKTLDPKVSQKDCCKFPTKQRPFESYTDGTQQFRAKRNKGKRRHAGCDLYRKKGEAAVAVASGTIIRRLYYFYQGVFALEVKHPKFIARYGELLGNAAKGVSKGKNVVAGQDIGYIGKVNSGCCAPMLHFEMYKGTSHGALTRYRLPPYDRRPDVMNPTDFLRLWEKSQFGKSY